MNWNYEEPGEETILELRDRGWHYIGEWRFVFNGLVYDLSAANINYLDRIGKSGVFAVASIVEREF